jgi:hypothetical protein
MGKEIDDQYSDEETKRRFEAALRGAREVGHEPMKDIPPKRSKLPASTKLGKRKTKASAKASQGVPSGAGKSKRGSK